MTISVGALTSTHKDTMPRDLQSLELLLKQREELLDEYARLEAEFAHVTWAKKRLDIEEARIKERIREANRDSLSKTDISAQLHLDGEYVDLVHAVIDGRRRWALARERWNLLGWRIQVEMANHRLAISDDIVSADGATDDEG